MNMKKVISISRHIITKFQKNIMKATWGRIKDTVCLE